MISPTRSTLSISTRPPSLAATEKRLGLGLTSPPYREQQDCATAGGTTDFPTTAPNNKTKSRTCSMQREESSVRLASSRAVSRLQRTGRLPFSMRARTAAALARRLAVPTDNSAEDDSIQHPSQDCGSGHCWFCRHSEVPDAENLWT